MHKTLVLSISFIIPTFVFSQNKPFQYFYGKDIDYWNEGKTVQEFSIKREEKSQNKKNIFSGSSAIRSKDTEKFSWDKYRNPENVEFWDDGGSWIPPRPFREAVIHPTKENIESYLRWMSFKTTLVNHFQNELHKISQEKSQNKITRNKRTILNNHIFNWNKIQVAYFYKSSCPHCQKSAPIAEKLKNEGANLQFIQMDFGANPPIHSHSIPYTKEIHKYFHIQSTPTWVLKIHNTYTQLIGEQSFNTLEFAAKKLLTEESMQ